jgi:hypothetical protein
MASIVELNKVASRKTGEIEAQCKLGAGIESLQNGQIVYIDAAKDEIVLTKGENCVDAMYLHFSNPRRYEDGKTGMENFIYTKSEKYLPRLYKLTAGDIFTTDYDLTGVDGLVVITAGNMPYGTLPNGKAGKTYRVIK